MRTWTVWDAVALVERSWCWMVFVTMPVTIVVALAASLLVDGRPLGPEQVAAAGLLGLIVAVASGVVSVGGGIVALPCTWLLGWALTRRALPRGVHVVAHAVLAGALGTLCVVVPSASWGSPLWAPLPAFAAVVGVAASTAAAIAARRTGLPADIEPAAEPDVSVRAAADE
ncbi:hypothetical protein HUN58_19525 [Curtobacterium sp. Csp1]|uniref:Uncharacterized protein n=1 Tax=Curtobacterium citreum TaxID=2036 RepID=A0ABT2HGD9_9MICO|nr:MULTISPECIES: hypothetical protein [Curtobacterium]MCS6522330.1 hypothetical protein [Curtobacterium citreum]QKS13078.1 hypothetical protein HUN60_07955 [Curtobacterium sp. csp3]QKS19304.1 hypothetical protein HUN58_04670 [Curtobacterium sp. Csp1]QKS21781.1 hypothetical protein HUN58_19525 [Curtobacterium sp. Csp1]TQJ29458.1 hypothetical protein FB462_3380 [Curtobacterium citreum]